MACREVRMLIHDFRRHFTNDDQAHDHSLLCSPVLQKLFFAQALYKRKVIASVAACQIIP